MLSNSPYKKMLDEHGFCIVSPIGSSMLPLIEEGQDTETPIIATVLNILLSDKVCGIIRGF